MTDLWQFLKLTDKPIFLYGMGNGADKIINTLDALNIKVSGVFVSDGFVRDKIFRGFKLKSYSQILAECDDFVVLVSFGTSLDNVMNNIKRIAKEQTLFAPDVPVFGDGLFDIEYCKQNKYRLEKIYNTLADEKSKRTFEKLVKYKITGKVNYLFECESDVKEPYNEFLNLDKYSTFVDLGAYRADTLKEFIENVGGYKKAYAVEPDKKTFAKLNVFADENTECINAAISDKEGIEFFEKGNGRGSHLSKSGEEIRTVCVDGILNGEKADYIKMDVEGAEIKALWGSENTIKIHKPKMCVAAYHRAYDLLDIPEKVLEIRPDYKIYLRHFPYIPAWDTNYYFV